MTSRPSIAALILTKNEERHLRRCLESLQGVADEVFIVDSLSTDATTAIAKEAGAHVLENPWVNYATQYNWGLDHAAVTADWILRIDADEYLLPESAAKLKATLGALDDTCQGALVKRRLCFMNRWMRRGGIYPVWHLRLWRRGSGRCEVRWMDEHIVLSKGRACPVDVDIVDDNHNSLTWWTEKHNSYASREAVDLLNLRHRFIAAEGRATDLTSDARRKRFLKEGVYSRLPAGLRALAYFVYRYVLRFGFLDGREGFAFHMLQGLWYRMLVDMKVYEIEREVARTGKSYPEAIRERFNLQV